MKRWIGIDPGSKGAFAMIPEEGEVEVYPFDKELFREKCEKWRHDDCMACVEKVSSSPQMGVKSAFTFGENSETPKAMLYAFYIPFAEVPPNKWKTEFSLSKGKASSKADKKGVDIECAKQLFPTVSLRRTPQSRTDDDNFADALLLALYAKRRL